MTTGLQLGIASLALMIAIFARWFMQVYAVNIPANRTSYIIAVLFGIGLGIFAITLDASWPVNICAGLSISLGSLYLLLVLISAQKGGPGKFQIGSKIPSFSAPDENGTIFNSDDLAGNPFLLKFFRGHW